VQYIGRNVLDAATLDRFLRIYFGYDEKLENALLSTEVQEIRDVVRRHIRDRKLHDFISTRTLLQIDKLLKQGFTNKQAVKIAMKPNDDIMGIIPADKPKAREEDLSFQQSESRPKKRRRRRDPVTGELLPLKEKVTSEGVITPDDIPF
jgi:hypothetical protein